jgi:hypothetical protein
MNSRPYRPRLQLIDEFPPTALAVEGIYDNAESSRQVATINRLPLMLISSNR